jgi:hypothetical protein
MAKSRAILVAIISRLKIGGRERGAIHVCHQMSFADVGRDSSIMMLPLLCLEPMRAADKHRLPLLAWALRKSCLAEEKIDINEKAYVL